MLHYQDTEDPEYEDFRAEASLQKSRQLDNFSKAAEAYKQGRKDVASFYAKQVRGSKFYTFLIGQIGWQAVTSDKNMKEVPHSNQTKQWSNDNTDLTCTAEISTTKQPGHTKIQFTIINLEKPQSHRMLKQFFSEGKRRKGLVK